MIVGSAGGGCPLCGAKHAACGQPSTSTPVDAFIRREPGVGPVRKYKVTVNGSETVLKLNDEDAKAYPDAQLVDEPASQVAGDEDTAAEAKSRTAGNKARGAANKADTTR